MVKEEGTRSALVDSALADSAGMLVTYKAFEFKRGE